MTFVSPPYDVLKCAFHCHFSWHNLLGLRRPSGLANVKAFHDAGFGAVAFTEHAYESNMGVEEETSEAWTLMPGHAETALVTGVEASYCDDPGGRFGGGDCLALFIERDIDCLSGPCGTPRPLDWLLESIHEQDGIAVIAHPRSSQARHPVGDLVWASRTSHPIDGWEVFNGGLLCVGRPEMAECHARESVAEGYITIASPDSHTPFQAACSEAACTYVFVLDRSAAGVKEAMLDRRTVAFANGALYGEEEWTERFKEWRMRQAPGGRDLWSAGLLDVSGDERLLISGLRSLAERYAGARFGAGDYRQELLALSDLRWRANVSEESRREIERTSAVLSQRMFELNEEEMLNWYVESHRQALRRIAADPDNAEAHYRAGEAGAFFPGVVSGFAEARERLEKALAIDPALHVARAALVNHLRKDFPGEALERCRAAWRFADATPYLAALGRHLSRL